MPASYDRGWNEMGNYTLPRARCYRCVYSWIPRHSTVQICPRCKSRLWNVPKIRPVTTGNGPGIEEVVAPQRLAIHRLMKKYGATSLKVFGSVRRREGRPESDVDLLVKWGRRRRPLGWLDLSIELEGLLGRRVDLVELKALHWAVRPQVLAEAVPI